MLNQRLFQEVLKFGQLFVGFELKTRDNRTKEERQILFCLKCCLKAWVYCWIIQLVSLVKMRFRERDQSSIRSYQRISLGKRKRLVEMIMNEGFSLSKVSKKLKLKLTTARLILKKYKQTGTFPMRNFKKKMIKSEKTDEQMAIKEEEVQESESENIQQKEDKQEDIVIEQPPIICYYFVNQMPPLSYLPQFWAGSMFPWI